ncbi:hypothetical protein GCM10029992_62630 [Glycomyces albus]
MDAYWHTIDDLTAALEAQDHRRFMKSHTPLDGLPFDERVTYISVGRDSRDAGISMDFHMANMNWDRVMEIRAATMPPEEVELTDTMPEPAPTLHERFWNWAESDDLLISLEGMLRHVNGFWEKRNEPNVLLLHYADMKADLEGQMRRIAAALDIEIDEDLWPDLVEAATFEQVRSKSETLAPENTIWKDKTEFFRKGAGGEWKDLLDESDLERYRARVDSLTTPRSRNGSTADRSSRPENLIHQPVTVLRAPGSSVARLPLDHAAVGQQLQVPTRGHPRDPHTLGDLAGRPRLTGRPQRPHHRRERVTAEPLGSGPPELVRSAENARSTSCWAVSEPVRRAR